MSGVKAKEFGEGDYYNVSARGSDLCWGRG